MPGQLDSPIALITRYKLPPRAMCRPDDKVVGVTILYDGRIAFVTSQAMVGVIPRQPKRMTDENLIVRSINGEDCDDPSVPIEDLEKTSNSVSSDQGLGLYPLTDEAQYKFRVRGDSLRQVWRAPYQTGTAEGGGVRLDQGSGSTPALMGTRPDDDRFVVITDGQRLMHLTLVWRNRIPRDWEGLPGRPRRIACEHPVNFGDPEREASQSEQSVTIRGYAAFVPNNELRNVDQISQLPIGQTPQQLAAGLAGQFPQHAPYGFERIDWRPRAQTCKTRWVNQQASIPNGVPYMSAGSEMVYGIGQRDGINGLEGMDAQTGESLLWVRPAPRRAGTRSSAPSTSPPTAACGRAA